MKRGGEGSSSVEYNRDGRRMKKKKKPLYWNQRSIEKETEKERNDDRRVREYGESIYDTNGNWKERRERGEREWGSHL